ncbi:hypothetical protein EON65_12095 [archaeon]|nr:MAG: hypothetical protein EON65_12095 [archaeon]
MGDGTDAVSDSIELRRAWINETLNLTFSEGLLILPDLNRLVPTSRSIVQGLCEPLSHTSDVTRSSCCSSPRMRHIYNVLFEADKMVLFGGRNQTHMNSLPKRLQGVRSYKMQQEIFFNRDIVTRDEEFNPAIQCKTYFEGTLHIIKRSTTHNVYHSGE